MPNLRRFKLNIYPAVENIRSTQAEEVGTLRYFFANSVRAKNSVHIVSNSKAHEILLTAFTFSLRAYKYESIKISFESF
jgi:hypothetical protein